MFQIKKLLTVISSFALIACFTLSLARHTGINADAMYSYSFAKDILTGVPLSTWFLPGESFLFPDTILSLPVVLLIHNPIWALCVLAALQVIAMILIIAFFQKTSEPFAQRFAAVTYLSVLIYFAGKVIFGITLADSLALLDHHLFGALIAFALHLWTSPERIEKASRMNITLSTLLFLLTSFSDPFCFFYFFAFVFARFCLLQQKTRRWLVCLFCFFVAGVTGIFVNHVVNPHFFWQIQYSTAKLNPDFLGWKSILFMLLFPLVLSLTKSQRNDFIASALGVMLIVVGICSAGLIIDAGHLCYIGILFPVIIYLLAELLPFSFFRATSTSLVSLIVIVFSAIEIYSLSKKMAPDLFQADAWRILHCKEFQDHQANSIVVSAYWSAKPLYELSGRSFRLLQTQNDLMTTAKWINNASWFAPLKNQLDNQDVIFVTYHLPSEKLDAIAKIPGSRAACHGDVILTKQSQKLSIAAPVLQKTF